MTDVSENTDFEHGTFVGMYRSLIQGRKKHTVIYNDRTEDIVYFKDVYILPTGLNVQITSEKNKRVQTIPHASIMTIDGKDPETLAETLQQPALPKRFVFSVIALTSLIKNKLSDPEFRNIWVSGEISDLKPSAAGHIYFSIKDDRATLNAVLFRGRAQSLKFKLERGLKIELRGSLSVYEPRGNYQFIAEEAVPEGKGALQLAFEQLKKKLAAEGFFDAARKRPIPRFPEHIGVITSPSGAAVHDIIKTTLVHFPAVHIIIYPSRVQGDGAAADIAAKIRLANNHGLADVLIVGRGGGSLEDLWAFNEEETARAVFESKIPVISVVGHEVDFTITDFTADMRCATPTAAAEFCTGAYKELKNNLPVTISRIEQSIAQKVQMYQERLRSRNIGMLIKLLGYNLINKQQRLDELTASAHRLIREMFKDHTASFAALAGKLHALSPFNVLGRGYSVVKKNDKIVTDADTLIGGDRINITFHRGSAEAAVETVTTINNSGEAVD